jgi:ABC-type antimicrobial peptide transport system permease subunit
MIRLVPARRSGLIRDVAEGERGLVSDLPSPAQRDPSNTDYPPTLGVYAVTAYGISRRRREMNIRVALGADRTAVTRLLLKEGFSPVAVGLAAGVAGALGLSSILSRLLFEIRARDPLVLAVVVALVGGIGLLACLVATRQGLVLNPAAALRSE